MSEPISLELLELLYNDMKTGFLRAGIWNIMEEQLNDYINVAILFKRPDVFFEGIINKNSRVALYGAGTFGQAMFSCSKANVVLWVDKNYKNYEKSEYKVEDVKALYEPDVYDEIFIAIIDENVSRSVKEQLVSEGINCKISFFTKDMKKR